MKAQRSTLLKLAAWSAAIVLPIVGVAGIASNAYAAGDASFSFSSGGGTTVGDTFTVTVSETSSGGDETNSVQANVSYPTGQLQYESLSLGAFNSLCPQQTGGSGEVQVACATTTPGGLSGTQTVATITFKVVGSGSGAVSMITGSPPTDIDNTSGSSVWNGSLTSASYSFSAASSGSSGGGSSSSGSSGGSSKSSGSSSGSSSASKSSTPSSSTPSTTTTTPTPAKTTTPTTTSSGASSTTSSTSVLSIAVDNSNGQPVEGAKVMIDNKYTAYTNAQGYAAFSDLAGGNHSVTVAKSGQTTSQSFSVTTGQSKTVSLKLASEKSSGSSSALYLYVVAGVVVLAAAAGFGYMKFFRPKAYTAPRPQGMVVGSGNTAQPQVQPAQPAQPPASTSPRPAIPTGPAPQQVVTPTTNTPPSVGTEVSAPPSSGSGQNPGNPPTVG